ncbi:hypothetical protein QTP88_016292 [Uroleucon formosanum]
MTKLLHRFAIVCEILTTGGSNSVSVQPEMTVVVHEIRSPDNRLQPGHADLVWYRGVYTSGIRGISVGL